MGPDVLVVYDTNMSEEREVEEGEKKKKSLLGKAAASLKGVMGKEPVASPIIELVPAHEQQQQHQAKPNTFQVKSDCLLKVLFCIFSFRSAPPPTSASQCMEQRDCATQHQPPTTGQLGSPTQYMARLAPRVLSTLACLPAQLHLLVT